MLGAPGSAGRSKAALHFVENQQHLVLIADRAQLREELAPEMIVAAFTLDRLDDNRRDINPALLDEFPNLFLGLLFARDQVRFALRFRQRKVDRWIGNPRPFEFGEKV